MLDDHFAGEVTLATVWLLGVSMGLTACTVTCLPFIGTWAFGRASGQREALLHTAVFLAGRVTTYTVLAAMAAAVGTGLATALGGDLGNIAIGTASIVAGLWLLAKPLASPCHAVPPVPTLAPVTFYRKKAATLPPLFLGAALSLTPCTPLATLLVLAAQSGSVTGGTAYGLAFGLGAAVTPILVLVPLAGRLGRELRSSRQWLSRWLAWGAAGVLIVLGLRRLLLALG